MAGQYGSMAQAYQSLRAIHFPADGNFYFVDGVSGSNSSGGLTPDTPKLTLTAAITLATSQNEDYIFLLAYHQASGETWPIVVAKRSMHIVGVTSALEDKPHINPTGETAALNLNGATYGSSRVQIANLGFCAGSTSGCIEINETCFGVKIFDCSFGHSYTGAQDGILVNAPYDAVELHVKGCVFGKMLTRDGIRVVINATRCLIENNRFDEPATEGIYLGVSAGIANPFVLNNYFNMKTDEAGEAIRIGAGDGGLISGNHMSAAKTDPTHGLIDGGSCSWGVNWYGVTATLPA